VPEAIEIQLKKGVLALCVLALLSRADSYAYEIASRLDEGHRYGGRERSIR
jgi:PadR family transcriptional regulator PadR